MYWRFSAPESTYYKQGNLSGQERYDAMAIYRLAFWLLVLLKLLFFFTHMDFSCTSYCFGWSSPKLLLFVIAHPADLCSVGFSWWPVVSLLQSVRKALFHARIITLKMSFIVVQKPSSFLITNVATLMPPITKLNFVTMSLMFNLGSETWYVVKPIWW